MRPVDPTRSDPRTRTIEDIARAVAKIFVPETKIEIAKKPMPGILPERYVPQTSLTKKNWPTSHSARKP